MAEAEEKNNYSPFDSEAIVVLPEIDLNEHPMFNRENRGSAPIDVESITALSDNKRYIDPLIKFKNHNLYSPYDREDVAAVDPLANKLTWKFHMRAWSKYPKFYESDEKNAPEIGQDIRQMLKSLNFHEPAIVACALSGVHGWSLTKFWTDNEGNLDYQVYSEYQIKYQNFIRDYETKRVIGWRLYDRPRLPLKRQALNYLPGYQVLVRDEMPNLVFLTRGEEKHSHGYGFSILEPVWDSITKLREESHANAFRARIFPISVVPEYWKKPQIQAFFDSIKNMDQTTALVTKSGKNMRTGDLIPELPSINWVTPGSSATGKSSSGAGGVFSELSSEWTRLCANTGHSIRWFVGNPGGALAAAEEDTSEDEDVDIQEFNMYREYIRLFLDWLKAEGYPIDEMLPEGFVIKCHWEWSRDEYELEQALMMEKQITDEDESHQKDMNDSDKENQSYNNGVADTLIGMLGRKKGASESVKETTRAKQGDQTDITRLKDYDPNTPVDMNKWLPVNSSSGNVEGVFLDSGDGNTIPTIFVSFKGGSIYSYQDTEISDPITVTKKIMAEGGDQVWEQLRASGSMRGGNKPGEHPKGGAKTGGGKFAYAGRAHMMDYKKERAGPIASGLRKDLSTRRKTEKVAKKKAKEESDKKKKPSLLKSVFKGLKKLYGLSRKLDKGLLGIHTKAWKNELTPIMFEHPILQRYNSVSEARREMHHSKDTIYKKLDQIETVLRFNVMHMGNSFSTKNPFVYESDTKSGFTVEYQCPESIKKLNGISVPIWIGHKEGDRVENEYVGTYTITGFDDESGKEIAEYDIDYDLVNEIFEASGDENWIQTLVDKGEFPDTSTEYKCNIKYDRIKKKFIQTNFQMNGLALVKKGNCSGDNCSIKGT